MKLTPQEERLVKLPYEEASSLAWKERQIDADWENWVGVVASGRLDGEFKTEIACAKNLSPEDRAWRNRSGRANHYGGCQECGDTWDWKMSHMVQVSESMGVFPTCEECWRKTTPAQAAQQARSLVAGWAAECGDSAAIRELPEIEKACVAAVQGRDN